MPKYDGEKSETEQLCRLMLQGGREGGTQRDEDLLVGFTSSQDRQCPDAAGRGCTLLRAVCGVMSVQLWCFDPQRVVGRLHRKQQQPGRGRPEKPNCVLAACI